MNSMNPAAPLDPATTPFHHRRRWLRVSLRGLMVLVVLIGGGAGWLANKIRTQRQAIAVVRAAGGRVLLDYQSEEISKDNRGRPVYRTEPSAPKWLRVWLGDELFQSVETVSFLDRPASPEAFAAMAEFDRMKRLTLGDLTGVGDGLRHLQRLNRLDHVWVAGPGVTDLMLGDLAGISTLSSLSIGGRINRSKSPSPDLKSTATDEGFAHLLSLRKLTTVSIQDCSNLSDSGLSRLVEGLPMLRSLALTGGPKSLTTALPALARHHPDLQSLVLDSTGVTDDDLKAVEGLSKLQTISLQNTPITDAGLVSILPLKNLVNLIISSTSVTDESAKSLSQLPSLTRLSMNKTKVTDAGLASLEKLANLRELSVMFSGLTDAGMASVGKISTLERLALDQSPGLTDAGLAPLETLKNLKQLSVVGTEVTDEGIAVLRTAIPTLRQVTSQRRRPTAPVTNPK